MNILVLGWADLKKAGSVGGGYNIVVDSLTRELSTRGHRLFYLNSGQDYKKNEAPHINPKGRHGEVECFSLINSKNLTPGVKFYNYLDTNNDGIENQLIVNFIRNKNIEIVHFHSMEGFNLSLATFIKEKISNVKVFVTPHDAFYFCPRVHFLYQYQKVCDANTCGIRCEDCINIPQYEDYQHEKNKNIKEIMKKFIPNNVKKILKGYLKKAPEEFEIGNYELHKKTFLKAIEKEDDGSEVYKLFKKEVSLLWKAVDGIQCLSEFHRDLLSGYEVDESKIFFTRLGLPHFDEIRNDKKERIKQSKPCFGYHGQNSMVKGFKFFIDYVKDEFGYHFLLGHIDKNTNSKLANLKMKSLKVGFSHTDLVNENKKYDIGIFPSLVIENTPLALLENLHAGIPCLVSDIGGATELVEGIEECVLFKPGNGNSFQNGLDQIIKKNVEIDREKLKTKLLENGKIVSFENFVDNTISLYEG